MIQTCGHEVMSCLSRMSKTHYLSIRMDIYAFDIHHDCICGLIWTICDDYKVNVLELGVLAYLIVFCVCDVA